MTLSDEDMIPLSDAKQQIRTFLPKTPARAAYLFGSYARGTETKRSDIDVIVIEDSAERFFDRYTKYNDLIFSLHGSLELLIYTPEEWDTIKERPFFRKITQEWVQIYERGKE